MRTLYLDCGMGAAGDMLMSALLELADDKAAFLEKMNGLGLPGVAVSAAPAVKCGITGTHVAVTVHGEEEVSYDVSPEGHIHHHDVALFIKMVQLGLHDPASSSALFQSPLPKGQMG